MTEASFFVGVDLGQAADYTAICVIEKPEASLLLRSAHAPQPKTIYNLRHLERVTLGTAYPKVAEHIKRLIEAPTLNQHATVITDATGVGVAVMDVFRAAKIAPLVPVSITGGDQTSSDNGTWRVPKRDLVMSLLVLFQNGRLKIAADLPLADIFRRELLNFKVKVDLKTAHDTYGAWREGDHDDLVLSVALACWWADRFGRIPDPIPSSGDPFSGESPATTVHLIRDPKTGKIIYRRRKPGRRF